MKKLATLTAVSVLTVGLLAAFMLLGGEQARADLPVANDDSATVEPGETVTGLDSGETSVLANDSDTADHALIVTVLSPPSNGVLTLNGDGTFSYTHNGGGPAARQLHLHADGPRHADRHGDGEHRHHAGRGALRA